MATTLNLQVSADTDDCWIDQSGTFYQSGYNSSADYFGNYGGDQYAGFRFSGATIPKGATIVSATLQIYVTGWFGSSGSVQSLIYASAEDNGGSWSASDRPDNVNATTAQVVWNGDAGLVQNAWYSLPDLKDVIQELVNRPGWASGGLRIICRGNGGGSNLVGAQDYFASPTNAAKLIVVYNTVPLSPTGSGSATVAPQSAGTGRQVINFGYARTLTIHKEKVPNTDQVDFPVYMRLSDPSLGDVAHGGNVQSSSGADFAFFSDAGLISQIPHFIESYDPVNGVLDAWVKCTVSASVDTLIYVAYGASVVTSFESPADVLDSYYCGWWYPDSRNWILDRSKYAGGGTLNNSVLTDGKIGKASYSGPQSTLQIRVPYSDAVNITGKAITVSCWVKPDADSQPVYAGILGKPMVNNATPWVQFLLGREAAFAGDRKIHWSISAGSDNSNTSVNAGQLGAGVWTHLVGTYDGQNLILYQDGSEVGRFASNIDIPSQGSSLYIGSWREDTPNSFEGIINQPRIAATVRSPDWVATEWNNQSSPATFLTDGGERDLSIQSATGSAVSTVSSASSGSASQIFNASSSASTSTLSAAAADEVFFGSGDGRVLTRSSGVSNSIFSGSSICSAASAVRASAVESFDGSGSGTITTRSSGASGNVFIGSGSGVITTESSGVSGNILSGSGVCGVASTTRAGAVESFNGSGSGIITARSFSAATPVFVGSGTSVLRTSVLGAAEESFVGSSQAHSSSNSAAQGIQIASGYGQATVEVSTSGVSVPAGVLEGQGKAKVSPNTSSTGFEILTGSGEAKSTAHVNASGTSFSPTGDARSKLYANTSGVAAQVLAGAGSGSVVPTSRGTTVQTVVGSSLASFSTKVGSIGELVHRGFGSVTVKPSLSNAAAIYIPPEVVGSGLVRVSAKASANGYTPLSIHGNGAANTSVKSSGFVRVYVPGKIALPILRGVILELPDVAALPVSLDTLIGAPRKLPQIDKY